MTGMTQLLANLGWVRTTHFCSLIYARLHHSSPGPVRFYSDSGWLAGIQTLSGPSSPTFSLVSRNPFGFKEEAPYQVQGRGCGHLDKAGYALLQFRQAWIRTADVPMSDSMAVLSLHLGSNAVGLVKPWEGERIHEECVLDDLELTLGNLIPDREIVGKGC
ncbi:hypothetical protein OIU76_026339 [Salix suchowensis]|nr:hypothetical protein OIU76_026339 [Salix suchowensis]